ncbi:unnamed protein product [Didymodactylos carnosus]|uniref:Exportin-7/Ran-binding protein 17 TPR repeats domain-containing protein n=1 Tax=Didymodactylos carnosus TaxID=1234261 RepID=A0A8S2GQP9_9BILA|nr:unnamed protein product [Didymodactylos carnosus]CAF3546478.1 unnamed protein product [Didymodactylos carnosus]
MDALEIERLCSQLYSGGNNSDQIRQASQRLETFVTQQDCLIQCRLLLDRSLTPYTQFFATTTLIKYFNKSTNQSLIIVNDRLELRSYILEYLYKRNTQLAPYVVSEITKLYARITKSSWFDTITPDDSSYPFQSFTNDLLKFQQDPQHFVISIQILISLINEIGTPNDEETTARAFSKHRKICTSFRDTKLLDIYLFALKYLKEVIDKQINSSSSSTVFLQKTPSTSATPTSPTISTATLIAYPKTLTTIQLQPDYYLVVERLLLLAHQCLTYDFLGTGSSVNDVDTSDECQTLQLPLSWHDYIVDPSYYELYFSYYFYFSQTTLVSTALACLVQISSVRRSLLNTNERLNVLNYMTHGIRSILEQPIGIISSEKPLHEFCRLICRLKCNVQLYELIKIDLYPQFIELLTKFTIDHLLNIYKKISSNTLYYILSFWSKIVSYLSHSTKSSNDYQHLLDVYVPEIVCYYIQSRLEGLSRLDSINDELIDDDLSDSNELYDELFDNDQAQLNQQLEQISTMSRIDYKKTCTLLCSIFDDLAQQYQLILQQYISPPPQQQQNTVKQTFYQIERRFTFLIYVISCVIGARGITLPSLSLQNDEQDLFDGELTIRALQLMTFIQQQTPSTTNSSVAFTNVLNSNNKNEQLFLPTASSSSSLPYSERLELAILYFFEQFRRQYISDHSKPNKIYQILFKHLGIADEVQLLSIFVKKLFTNLQYSTITEKLIERTLFCFNDLSQGYNSVRKLVKLEPIQYFINNHTQDYFPFLNLYAYYHLQGGGNKAMNDNSNNSNQILLDDSNNGGTTRNLKSSKYLGCRIKTAATTSLSSSSKYTTWSRLRTIFYSAVGRLLMHEFHFHEEDDERFEKFMLPFTLQCQKLIQIFKEFPDIVQTTGNIPLLPTTSPTLNAFSSHQSPTPSSHLKSSLATIDEIKAIIVGLVRDLRGLCFAFISKQSYTFLFDWLYPKYIHLFMKSIYYFYDTYEVYNPILKFFHEFVSNRQERLVFECTKPNAYLLFRETSHLMYVYQTKTLNYYNQILQDTDQYFYEKKLKSIMICFRIIRACLSGNYLNFGIFHLYSDSCFENTLNIFVSMLLTLKQDDLLLYPKLTLAYYSLVETLAVINIEYLSNLNSQLFGYILNTISEGLLSFEQSIQNSCCVYLDLFLTHVFRSVYQQQRKQQQSQTLPSTMDQAYVTNQYNQMVLIKIDQNQNNERFLANINEYEQLFRQILINILNSIIYDECKNMYSISKPLLGLILLNENQFFNDIKKQLLYGHPIQKQQALSTALEKLMNGIDRTLTSINKEHFTQNITLFRKDIQDALKLNETNSNDQNNNNCFSGSSGDQTTFTMLPIQSGITQTIPSLVPTSSIANEMMTM